MAGSGSSKNGTWPMPKFRFQVDFGSEIKNVAFQDVSGMDVENQIVEYRESDSAFWNWPNEISMNTIKCPTMLIKLLDEGGKVTVQWQLDNAWPTKVSSGDLKVDRNEVVAENVEIAHKKLTIINVS
jgi:hypothetical protein